MQNIFFSSTFFGIGQTILTLLILIGCASLLVYILFFFLSKILYRKSAHRRELTLRLTFLWTLFAFLILIDVYLSLLFYYSGVDKSFLANWRFYLGIISQIILFFLILTIFLIKRNALRKIINENSLI